MLNDSIIPIPTGNLKENLVELSITNLMNCLADIEKKEEFVSEVGVEKYKKVVRYMREESTVISMRDFHNWVKLVLITNIADFYYRSSKNPKTSLLDIAVGRGGDLSKWEKAELSYVFGFDP